MRTKGSLFLLLCAGSLALCGCAARPAATVRPPAAPADTLDHLREDLERIFSDPAFSGAQWGVEVLSLDRGDVLYERNSRSLYMPASNNKILTVAAALLRLGPDFRYQTTLSTDGEIADGMLRGNLVITGMGDPSSAARFHEEDPFGTFRGWARRLKALGVAGIKGALIADGRSFPEPSVGFGWEWDDLPFGYAAPVTALQFNENLLTIEISPGAKEGEAILFRCSPLADCLSIASVADTAAPSSPTRLGLRRADKADSLTIYGSMPAGSAAQSRTVAIQDPVRCYLLALRKTLAEEEIDVSEVTLGPIIKSGDQGPAKTRLLFSHPSAPLSEIIKPLLKLSQNLYAETLVRTLGLAEGREGSFEAGSEVVEVLLQRMAIERGSYSYADGSGLSRHNLISADLMIKILRYMYRHRDFAFFYEAFPIAGVDGTIRNRMRGTKAENNVRAKTGSIAQVRSLSGYVRTAGGEMLAFAMLANNFLVSSRSAEYLQDSALERLANFNRP